jgi:hypothetical protein
MGLAAQSSFEHGGGSKSIEDQGKTPGVVILTLRPGTLPVRKQIHHKGTKARSSLSLRAYHENNR